VSDNERNIHSIMQEVKVLEDRICNAEERLAKLEDKFVELDKSHSQLETLTANLIEKIEKFDIKLDSIVEELRNLSTQLAVNETKHKFNNQMHQQQEERDNELLGSLLHDENRPLLLLILILGASLMFALGMNVGDIVRVLGG